MAQLTGSKQEALREQSPFSISVILVNFNGRRYLERCLSSLAAQTCPAFEIVVVDNASTDNSREYLADWAARHPQCHLELLYNPENVGFAEGNNLGALAARGDLLATLNTDTEVEPDYLAALARPMLDARVGACAPLMLEMDRRDVVDASGLRVDWLGFAWNVGAGRPRREFTQPRAVFGACAGAALYRRTMFEQLGGFDGSYFAYYEDADLAWRARRAGWRCVFVPEARVYHVHGGSFGRSSPLKLYLLARNRWWTLRKNYPRPALLFALPFILAADLAALFTSLIRHRSLAPLQGRVAGMFKGIARAPFSATTVE